ncbi:hypothetical protein HK405_005961 [Cladochytrium tenue]|nr:hypothetical protein HK405_005961 [Cladochytrium tenue]
MLSKTPATAAAAPRHRELKIKTGVVRRLTKELAAYHNEATKQQERIDRLVANGADEYDVRKQQEVLEETHQVIPDTRQRLATAREELEKIVTAFEEELGASPPATVTDADATPVGEDEDLAAAKQLLASAAP